MIQIFRTSFKRTILTTLRETRFRIFNNVPIFLQVLCYISYVTVKLYRGLPHQTVSFGHWLTHVTVQHLVLDSTTLECNIWSRVEPNWTATLPYDFTSECCSLMWFKLNDSILDQVLHSNMIEPKIRFCTLMCVNQ